MEHRAQVGDRISDKSTLPNEPFVSKWLGRDAFVHWVQMRSWIATSYPGLFEPDWLYGGKRRGWSLRYKKRKAFCTLLPAYKQLSVLVVLGRAEREKFEERRYFWSPRLLKLYDDARTHPDGKWLTIPISTTDDREEVMELLQMKRPALARS